MSIFGGLGNMLEGAINQHPGGVGGVLSEALGGAGGLDGVLSTLNNAGLGEKVNSWLGKGQNVPLTADEVTAALDSNQLSAIAGKLGIPSDQVAQVLAQHLPKAVDQLSPNGKLELPAAAGGVAGAAADVAAASASWAPKT